MTIPLAMTIEELKNHRGDIQRQAIEFYKSPNVFAGLPKRERWSSCIRLVADCWLYLGPQSYASGPTIYL